MYIKPSLNWRRKWQLTPVFLPGESHEKRSLVSYSPWDLFTLNDFTQAIFIIVEDVHIKLNSQAYS